ncbi:MAG TPA: hypothetical protein VII13_20010 [Vicinamibacteria bacterium]|jgi:Spy/CpxP family protein refolding chaperone
MAMFLAVFLVQSGYAGQEARVVKALSAEETAAYLGGEGMGLARAAELNHYPGPKHVLELGDALGLGPDQRRGAEEAFARMQASARALGASIVAEERALDGLFAAATIDERTLAASVQAIARLQGDLRLAHLRAHLEVRALLGPEQVAAYDRLRGYGARDHDPARHRP